MKAFDVTTDGELNEVELNNSVMTEDKVLLVVDDSNDRIYIWKGTEANVRKRFIATRHASGMRVEKGLEYKVESIDQDDEPNSFRTLIGKPIIVKTQKGKVAMKDAPPTDYDNAGPLYTGQGAVPESTPSGAKRGRGKAPKQIPPEHTAHRFPVDSVELTMEQSQPPADLSAILENLKTLEVPDGYLREVILIGRDLYSITERRRRFFGKDTTERDIEKIAQPPEGTFFATEYTPRIVINNGEVIAIEFLKATATAEAIKPKEMKGAEAHLSELVGFFQKIGKKPEIDEMAGDEYNF